MTRGRLRTGLVGLGRLGRTYARSLASLIPAAELVAVCDTDPDTLQQVADEVRVTRRYADAAELVADDHVEAVVIVTPTDTHRGLLDLTAAAGKPVFCEKPLSISLEETLAMKETVERSGIFFQMGFQRRFDRGYAAAKSKIEAGTVGTPVMFKSTSRDPYLPSLDYLATSGGIFVDMGIHDFDLALWLFGKIERVTSVGGALAYPEVASLGDLDNAIVSLNFRDTRIGVVDLSRNAVYGYDIATEILGTRGTLRVGYLRETPILEMTQNRIAHDTVPHFPERFAQAYTSQLENFVQNVLDHRPPAITIDDGVEALRVAVAATRSYERGETVPVA